MPYNGVPSRQTRSPTQQDDVVLCQKLGPTQQVLFCHVLDQIPSTGLRHPSFGGGCRKAMLGQQAQGKCGRLPLLYHRHWMRETAQLQPCRSPARPWPSLYPPPPPGGGGGGFYHMVISGYLDHQSTQFRLSASELLLFVFVVLVLINALCEIPNCDDLVS